MQTGEPRTPLDGDVPGRHEPGLPPYSDLHFAKRVAIAIGVAAIAYFLWLSSDVLLLVFAAILVAILLQGAASLLAEYARVPAAWSLPLGTILLAAGIGLCIYLFGAQLAGELSQLAERLPDALDTAGARLGIENSARRLEDAITAETGSGVLSRVTRWSFSLFGILANIALVLVAAVYLAADPRTYRRGFAMLFPRDQHERVFDALDSTGRVLRHWLAGQFVTMILVGVLSALVYWWIGLPSPIALGVIAGVTNFIPFVGPFVSAIPPLLLALAMSGDAILWTLAAVVVIQQFEGNVATPLIQRRAVSLPPAVGVFAVVVFGLVFGVMGVFFAVPLAASLQVLIRKLWVRQTLNGEPVAADKV